MSVTNVLADQETHTLTLTAEYSAPIEDVWQLWADPRQLERWWGPPTYPATVTQHDFSENGLVRYEMTSPEGEKFPGWWRVLAVQEPTELQFEDGFGDPDDVQEMPVTRTRVTISAADGRTRMLIESTFASAEEMAKLMAMGMQEGLTAAVGQIDELLAAVPQH